MTIQQLRYVIKIVECGSITEAARQLFISQPSLSAAVKELELSLIHIYTLNEGKDNQFQTSATYAVEPYIGAKALKNSVIAIILSFLFIIVYIRLRFSSCLLYTSRCV